MLSCSLAEDKWSLSPTLIHPKTFHLGPKASTRLRCVFFGDSWFPMWEKYSTYLPEQLYLEDWCILLYVYYTSIKNKF